MDNSATDGQQAGSPLGLGLSEGLGVTPPSAPRPFGYAQVFTPWMQTRKLSHGFVRTVAVYSEEQMEARDKQWLALLGARPDA
jgi:hypothetical protein